ncbi:MAG: sugar transporter ATP-binding protein [Rhodoglobus sp.]|nr:sugar transporter ATP-binding protein [Rhodoglobus sp.]
MPVEARLSIRNLSVSFGSHRALDGLDLDIQPGHIVGLLGANGSGKSTTVKALSGLNPVEPGATITLAGKSFGGADLDPVESRRRGIRVVHQEAPLVPDLTVAEAMAIHLGFPTTSGFIRWKALRQRSLARLAEFDIAIDPDRLCRSLSAAERALVSLAIALGDISVERAVLILDEATASLSTADASRFLAKVRDAADRGLAVLMVTHRLPEVRQHCDEVVVLRDGVSVATFTRETFDEIDVVHAMVGPTASQEHEASHEPTSSAGNALTVTALSGAGIDEVSFTVRSGEVLGITGRSGGGASELLRLLGGIDVPTDGLLELNGEPIVVRGPREAIGAGIFYISADRLTEGGVATMTVAENLVLPRIERYGLGRTRAAEDVARMMTALDVRPPDATVPFGSLSGGNQQKVLLARWLLLEPRVLLLDDPTVGVDPNTREVMFRTLRSLADAGTTVLLRSSEPEQLARLCDRVLVVRDGRIVNELTAGTITTEEISLATYA